MSSDLKSKTISGVSWKFAERICAQGVSTIVAIVLARILMPSDYAVVSIVTIFFTFANVFISGGFSSALIQKKETDWLDYSSVLHISFLTALILYAVMFFLAPVIAKLYDISILVPIIRVMGLTFFINAVKSVVCAYVSHRMQFKKFFFATIIGTVISAIVGIWMAKTGFGAWALVAQQMVNSFIDTVILFITTKFKIIFKISMPKIKVLFKYGWKVFVTSIISVTYDEASPLIVGIRYTTEDLAYYTKGKSFPTFFGGSLSDTFAGVLLPAMSKVQDDKVAVLKYLRNFMRLTSYTVFPVLIGFLAVSDSFVRVVLTEKWMFASFFIKIFCITEMLRIINTGNLQAIYAIGRSDVTLVMEIIKKSSYAVVLVLFVIFAGSVEVFALSAITTSIIAALVNSFPNRKLLNYRYRLQVWDLLPNFIIAGIMGVIVYFMNYININNALLLLLQIVSGAVIYSVLSILTKNKNFIFLLDLIKERRTKRNDKKVVKETDATKKA
ncbi:MAG: lipopolysaccharide biosynthesis protein [Clostridia bacterium]|nr:lipopolysaccharide biosynthesis protein [Clostridia bacterium]